MSGETIADRPCLRCGFIQTDNKPQIPQYCRWHIRGRPGVRAYVESLSDELQEWLLALFVDKELNLLAVETIARGDLASCRVNVARVLCRGHALNAAAFILVHNHPSGDPKPSMDDIRATKRLADIAADFDMPLLDHLIVAKGGVNSVGWF